MGYVEKSFPAAQLEHLSWRNKFASQRTALWGNEHMHARLTAAALLLAALVSRLAGLSIAPLMCVVFALVLLVADVRTLFGKHD